MKEVKVKKTDLLDKLKQNRDGHEKIFQEAIEGYRKRVIELLETNLSYAKAGKSVNLYDFQLQRPVNQTKEYNRAIAMLEMSVDEDIILNQNEFASYVMDDWGWKGNFLKANSLYSGTAAVAASELDED
jgi:hypothetical protein